eukprot:36963-Amphidinium_carterae.2
MPAVASAAYAVKRVMAAAPQLLISPKEQVLRLLSTGQLQQHLGETSNIAAHFPFCTVCVCFIEKEAALRRPSFACITNKRSHRFSHTLRSAKFGWSKGSCRVSFASHNHTCSIVQRNQSARKPSRTVPTSKGGAFHAHGKAAQ